MKRRNLRFEVKLAKEIEKAKTIGREKALWTMDKLKHKGKNLGLLLKKKLLELEPNDTVKMLAVFGVTVAIKNGVDFTQASIRETLRFAQFGGIPLLRDLGIALDVTGSSIEGETMDLGNEALEWLVAFGLAYLIVENFGEIVTTLGTGLTSVVGLAKTLLGAGLVPTP